MNISFKQLVVVLCIFLSIFVDLVTSKKSTSTRNTIVVFDPYVSILDKYNRFRYNQTDLLPLIKTISGKFQHVCIPLSQYDLDEDFKTSVSLAPEAVAHFNNMNDDGSIVKMKVWLHYSSSTAYYKYQDSHSYHNDPLLLFNRLNLLAKKTNELFNDTVTAVLLHHNILSNIVKFLRSDNITIKALFTNVQNWGFVVEEDSVITDARLLEDYELLLPDILLYTLPNVKYAAQFPARMKQWAPYMKHYSKRSWLGATLAIPDTDVRGTYKLSDSVSLWNFATQFSITIILSKAFDTPYEDSLEGKTSGWWVLLEDENYNSTADYKFVEKSHLLNQAMLESNAGELHQIPDKLTVSKDHVGIIFSLFDTERAKTRNEPPEIEDELLGKVAAMFRKVVILVHDTSREGREVLRCEIKNLIKTNYKFEITLVFLPGTHPNEVIKRMDEKLPNNVIPNSPITNMFLQSYLEPIKTYILPYVGNNTDKEVNYLRNTLLKSADVSNYIFGYTFNISLCTTLDRSSTYDKNLFDYYMKANDVRTIVIYFEESEETTKLGKERMFNRTVIQFLQCKKFLAERIDISNVTLSFMMLHYGSSSKFYDRKSAVLTLVEYWQKLSDWAKSENTTVILNNVMDTERRIISRGQYVHELGWWKFQDVDVGLRIPTSSGKSNGFIDKIEYAKWRFTKPTVVQEEVIPTRQLIPAIVLPIIVMVLVAIGSVWWIRGARRDKVLTKAEVEEFFKGRQHKNSTKDGLPEDGISEGGGTPTGLGGGIIAENEAPAEGGTPVEVVTPVEAGTSGGKTPEDRKSKEDIQPVNDFFKGRPHKIPSKDGTTIDIQSTPYDKERYEVDSFRIFEKIGSGEYGMVHRGNICKMDIGSKCVAVKMMNPKNVQSIAIKGLLSEIKVLSHVGQHENIVELLGANTKKLRFGEVYVFLEYCQLGSLETYLREMRPTSSAPPVENRETDDNDQVILVERAPSDEIRMVSPYADVTLAMVNNSLDASLQNDMYRWSYEICNGMEYLASKHVVHADIATRNVLLNEDKVAKICDFGLSRRLYSYKNYKKKSTEGKESERLPWKWISPESLRLLEFNEKSDVWAYGVTLWEIYTLGDEPYCGITWDTNFVNTLEDGVRLTKPKYNDENDMFSIMKQCWEANPMMRPTFSQILQTFRRNSTGNLY